MIKINNLCVDLGEFHLQHIDFFIQAGEYMVLLGPTGAGKTVLLECLIGIHRLKSGEMIVDEHIITKLEPEERNISYVPQDYALFPNMTVEKNIGYGLHVRRKSKKFIKEKVLKMMQILKITHIAHRYSKTLSGGEKQRVALGRALVTDPTVVLLDEPLSALDENMCYELADELKEIQRMTGSTFLHVCHNFEEAAYLADRVAIMDDNGHIAQTGTIDDILHKPQNLFVAKFTRCRNVFNGFVVFSNQAAEINFGKLKLVCAKPVKEGEVIFTIRPEKIILLNENEIITENIIQGRVISLKKRIMHFEIIIQSEEKLIIYLPKNHSKDSVKLNDNLNIHIPADAINIFFEDNNKFQNE